MTGDRYDRIPAELQAYRPQLIAHEEVAVPVGQPIGERQGLRALHTALGRTGIFIGRGKYMVRSGRHYG